MRWEVCMTRWVGWVGVVALLVWGCGGCSRASADSSGAERLSEEATAELVATHNRVRAMVKAPPLVWEPKLAAFAQEWAEELKRRGCDLKHRPRKGEFAQKYGENLYWGSPVMFSDGRREVKVTSAEKVVLSWASESSFYDAATHTCAAGKVCGHYTQVVWSETQRVGCAQAVCEDRSQVWVCNYDPPGNFLGRHPF